MTSTTFNDFDEFADSIRGIAGRFMPTAPADGEWWLAVGALGCVELQELQVGGASTYAGDGTPNTLTLGIPLTDPRRIRIDGQALKSNGLIVLKRDQPFTFAAREATRWGGITIHLPEDGHAGMFDAERLMASLAPGTRAQSHLGHLNRLRQFIMQISPRDFKGFADPAAARAAEEDVLSAVVQTIEACSVTREERHAGRPQVARSRVIAAVIDTVEAKQGEPLLVADLCREARVSERTLRNVCQEYFGVGPIRLLKARQLLEIRRALLASDPAQDAVARIAASHGVWDFSLFARHYKRLYGEAPSASLRKPPSRTPASLDASWLAYVARMFTNR